jgi:hypothetical protein
MVLCATPVFGDYSFWAHFESSLGTILLGTMEGSQIVITLKPLLLFAKFPASAANSYVKVSEISYTWTKSLKNAHSGEKHQTFDKSSFSIREISFSLSKLSYIKLLMI